MKENIDLDATVAVPQGKAFGSKIIRRWITPEPVSRRGRFIYAVFIDAIKRVQLNQRKRMEAFVAWFEVKPDTWVGDYRNTIPSVRVFCIPVNIRNGKLSNICHKLTA